MHLLAIQVLGIEAMTGYFNFSGGRESPRRPPDFKEAFRLAREGASLGCVDCAFRMGSCSLMGRGTKVNLEKAFKWVQKAAEEDHVGAMILFGQMYLRGAGVETSFVQFLARQSFGSIGGRVG